MRTARYGQRLPVIYLSREGLENMYHCLVWLTAGEGKVVFVRHDPISPEDKILVFRADGSISEIYQVRG